MAYAIYADNNRWVDILGPIYLDGQMSDAIKAYDKSRAGAGKIRALAAFYEAGATDDVPGVMKDITELLTAKPNMPKNVSEGFLCLTKLLKKCDKIAGIGEA